MRRPATPIALLILALLALAAIATAVAVGSSGASLEALWPGADGNALSRSILLDLRLPRALTAFGTGAVLALAGLVAGPA